MNKSHYVSIVFSVILLIMTTIITSAEDINMEVPGGFPEGSSFENQEISNFAQYKLVLSPEKNNSFEAVKSVEGKIMRTFAYLDDQTTEDVFRYYKESLEKEGFEILFSGHGDELGGDFQDQLYELNPWEHDSGYAYSAPFKSSSSDTQFYLAAKKDKGGKNIYVTLNTISGWTRHPGYRLDVIESGTNAPEVVSDTEPGKKKLPVGMIKGSIIEHREIVQLAPYNLVLSPSDDDKGFTKVDEIEGTVARTFYTIEDQSTYAIYSSYMKQLKSMGYEVLFSGKQSELGEDFQDDLYEKNPWDHDSNYAYSVPFKEGTIHSQYYAAFKKSYPNKDVFVTLIAVKGWSSVADYRIDIIETDAELPEVITSDAITIAMNEKGRMAIYGIYFNTGSHQILKESEPTLQIIADYIKNSKGNFFIVGHTDNRGGLDMNMTLSENRAKSVKTYLIDKFNIDKTRLTGHGAGPLCPVFSNDSESGRKFNRRVEIVKQ